MNVKVPWWALAVAIVLLAAAIYRIISADAKLKAERAIWQRQADSIAAVTKAAADSVRAADSANIVAHHIADSLAHIADSARVDANQNRAAARAALARLRADSLHRGEVVILDSQLTMDSAALATAYFEHVADTSALSHAGRAILTRDDLIRSLQTQLAIQVKKPEPLNPHIVPFAQAGVAIDVGGGVANTGWLVVGGVKARLLDPVAIVAQGQYSEASHRGSAQALVQYDFR